MKHFKFRIFARILVGKKQVSHLFNFEGELNEKDKNGNVLSGSQAQEIFLKKQKLLIVSINKNGKIISRKVTAKQIYDRAVYFKIEMCKLPRVLKEEKLPVIQSVETQPVG